MNRKLKRQLTAETAQLLQAAEAKLNSEGRFLTDQSREFLAVICSEKVLRMHGVIA